MEYGCIGRSLPHSFSREIHELIGSYGYVLKEIEPEDLPAFMKSADFKGINVTIPYKQAVIPFLSRISENARSIGAVNTVVKRNGELFGDNTDFSGMDALLKRLGLDPSGKKVLILGTGGTSRTAGALMKARGAGGIIFVSRSQKDGAVSYEEAVRLHSDAGIIINTTPSGMYPKTEEQPVDLRMFPGLLGLVDAVYNPLRTNLVQQAEELGIRAEGGLYMLVAQAVYASELFTGRKLPDGRIDGIFKKIRSDKENIVLTGMSGAGKSALGKALQRITARKLADTDELIMQRAGCPVTEIFAKYGEAKFRELEADVIREVSAENGVIISTGGGAVLREENVRNLKKNGRIFFLRREISEILPDPGRPLADTEEKVVKLYKERLPVYQRTADQDVRVTGTPEDTAKILLRMRLES